MLFLPLLIRAALLMYLNTAALSALKITKEVYRDWIELSVATG